MLTCEYCGITDESVTETIEPDYIDESGNEYDRPANLCFDCYYERQADL